MSDTNTNMGHMAHLEGVAAADVAHLREKELTYRGSWKRSGGRSAWFMLKRKIDRLAVLLGPATWPESLGLADVKELRRTDVEHVLTAVEADFMVELATQEDVFLKIEDDSSGADGTVLAEVRDLRRYLLLVEAEMVARGVVVYSQEVKDELRPVAVQAAEGIRRAVRDSLPLMFAPNPSLERLTRQHAQEQKTTAPEQGVPFDNTVIDEFTHLRQLPTTYLQDRARTCARDIATSPGWGAAVGLLSEELSALEAELRRRGAETLHEDIYPQVPSTATTSQDATPGQDAMLDQIAAITGRPGTPEDGGHHARQPVFDVGPAPGAPLGPRPPERIEDGLPFPPTTYPYILLQDPRPDPLGPGGSPGGIYYSADRRKLPPDRIDHLPRLAHDLTHFEWTQALPEYRGLYAWSGDRYRLRPEYVERWGVE